MCFQSKWTQMIAMEFYIRLISFRLCLHSATATPMHQMLKKTKTRTEQSAEPYFVSSIILFFIFFPSVRHFQILSCTNSSKSNSCFLHVAKFLPFPGIKNLLITCLKFLLQTCPTLSISKRSFFSKGRSKVT